MKNYLLLISLILFSYVSQATTYYVSTTGSDNNPGTILQPFKTWDKLTGILVAGDIAYIRGGTYYTTKGASASRHVNWENMIGQSNNYITIQNYPGESPIFDCSNIGIPTSAYPWIVYMTNCPYVKVKGLHVRNLDQIRGDQGFSRGWLTDNSPGAILEQIEVDHIGGAGFILQGSDNVQYINCDSHHQADPYSGGSAGAYGGGDGFDCVGGDNSTNTTYTGCRAWLCSDDGWDNFKTDGVRTWNNCWSFLNGYTETSPGVITATGDGNGFKLGPANPDVSSNDRNTILRFMNNCLAFNNSAHGWDQNGAPTMRYQIYNCTSYKNGGIGFDFGYQTIYPGLTSTFKNNVAFQNGSYPFRYCAANTSNTNNTWTGGNSNGNSVCGWTSGMTVTNADFLSVSTLGTDGARQSNGSLPNLNFLKLAATSGLINKGVNVGLPYISSAPDLGAFESNGSSSNVIPIANAGSDQTITLPTSSVNLNGTGTDPDGTISSYLWTKTSGPTSGTISNNTAATTAITGLVQGTYQFQLSVTDNTGASNADIIQVIVNAVSVNTAPIANAGADKIVVLPITTVSLTGTGTDPGGSISSYLWTKISGPTVGTIVTTTSATTSVSGLAQGVYQFELKVTDNAAATGKDTVRLTVNASGNLSPTANAGTDKSITLPVSTVSLTGTGTDADGTIASYLWTKISGPTGGTIATATTATTSISGLTAGEYQFELKVTDNVSAAGKDTVRVTVSTAATVNNAYGGVRWAIPGKIEAENFDIGGQNAAYYDITTGNSGGEYRSSEDVDIELSSEVSPNVGYIVAGEWMKYSVTVISTGVYTILARVSSPNAGTSMKVEMDGTVIATIAIPNTGGFQAWQTVTIPNVSLVAGNKVMRIYAVSTGFNLNYLTYTINASGNLSPTANAGTDKSITLPVSTVSLTGSGTDADGTISSYSWSKISGPTGGTIVTATAATTSITGLTQGIYKFELMVTDNISATGKDTVQVTVNAVSVANNAYGGVRWAIPGTIQAENYDVGGQNVGYYDNSTGNSGGSYRSPDEVDIVPCNEGGYFVGWSLPGEWMKYSVNVTSTGTYTLQARIACTESGKSFRIEMDGIIIATVLPPVTGGIQNWLTVSIPNINLTAGNKIMKIYWITGWGVNINYVKFTATSVLGLRSNSSDSTNLEEAETTVTTFPLPFSTSFTVNLFGKTNGIYSLTLTDLTGNAVWKKEVTKNSESFNETLYMGNLLNGVYILEVISPDKKKSAHKLIKN